MFLMKKIVSRLLFPMPLTLELLLVGLFLLWFTRRQRAGKVFITCGMGLLLGLSNSFTSNALLRPLEHRYPALLVAPTGAGAPAVGFILVLGGGGNNDPDVPITSNLTPGQMVRLIEGVRLYREIPGSKLILSEVTASPEGMTNVAKALGVKPEDILHLSFARDTEEESRQVAPIVGSQRFILVTSAVHMPRAMRFFQSRGLQPIAAPTDHLAPRKRLGVDDAFPDGYYLFKSKTAWYEYLGLAWQTLKAKPHS
jgi:uncharacterized SAM-binding protein YcdF (DUF218 family)